MRLVDRRRGSKRLCGLPGVHSPLSIMEPMTTIRPAAAADVPQILAFVRELAEYEREPDAVKVSEDELLRDGFPAPGQSSYYECLIAEEDGEPAGFALFFPVYSPWRGRSDRKSGV